jgi:peptide/nickel transport system substrate-binding protein
VRSFFKSYFSHITNTLRGASSREAKILGVAAIILIIGALGSVWTLNNRLSVEVPASGGTLREGVIGSPRFINPVLATSDVDRDLTALVYSGLMRKKGTGEFIPDLAESYTVSEDRKTYTFTLRDNAYFHDGKRVTAEDIVFTIEKIQDGTLKSPLRISWIDVTLEAPDEKTIIYRLKQPYAGFLASTTVGILPKHIWGGFSADEFQFSQKNIEPIGSGPFYIQNIKTQKHGTPVVYQLHRFRRFTLGKPYIKNIEFKLYANEQALQNGFESGDINEIHAFRPAYAQEISRRGVVVRDEPLPRIFAVFFNQSKTKILRDAAVVDAMNLALDRTSIIDQVLSGYGSPLAEPLPPMLRTADKKSVSPNQDSARMLLDKAGWILNPETGIRERGSGSAKEILRFTLSTANTPDLSASAQAIKEQMAEIGIDVEIRLFELGNLDRDVIRPREYEALLFGQVIKHDTDLYAFWHSSQRNDPGLNVALYANPRVDQLLERALITSDHDVRLKLYSDAAELITKDRAALFLYAPHFLYTTDKDLRGIIAGGIITPSDRFQDVSFWYLRTNRVWPFFDRNQ